LVALGTSLPELATAIVAAYHRHSDVALGNVVGSNIFNTLGIMGIVPFFGTIPVPPRMMLFDMWVMLGVTTLFIVWIMVRHSLGRIMASLFLTAYGFYIACHYFGLFGLSALAALPQ
ncbi:MAG: sodium:calcium antiporter, partial [Kiloniellaceae bacterium]